MGGFYLGVGLILVGDAVEQLRKLDDKSVHCCVTSPPYWGLRDYGVDGQLGLEKTPDGYVEGLVKVFREVRRVLKDNGTLWLNLGDCYATGAGAARSPGGKHFGKQNKVIDSGSYAKSQPNRMKIEGLKPKDLVGIPWRVAFALQADGWWLRSEIIWNKPNCLPESVKDRPTKAHETIFLLAKSRMYYYDSDAIREPHKEDSLRRTKRKFVYKHKPPGQEKHTLTPDGFCHPKGKNKRSVWTVGTKPFKGAHFATFPPDLIEPCVLAGCPVGGTVLDPFLGSGTTGVVAAKHNRKFIGIELNPKYAGMASGRIVGTQQELSCK